MQDPNDVEVQFGSNAVFKCKAEGDPIPEIKWMLNSNEISSEVDTRIHISSDGTLQIDRIDERDQGVLMEKSILIYISGFISPTSFDIIAIMYLCHIHT